MGDPLERQEDDHAAANEAIAWHVRLKDPIATRQDRLAFEAWLAADPTHRLAYDDARRAWDAALEPAQLLGADGWHRGEAARRPFRLGLALTAMLIGMLGCAAIWRDPGLLDRALADHAAAPGDSAEILLVDGTRVILDGDSAISVAITAGRRDVVLRRGRAWFEVPHREGPPFRVLADDVITRDVGTAFAVERGEGSTLVTVEQGEVAVSVAADASGETHLSAGQRVRVDGAHVGATEAIEPGVALAWRRGLVVFDRAPLSAVVAQLDRMHAGRVLVTDPELRRQTLSGVFRADDREAVLSALRTALGVRITRVPGLLILISR